jgi:ABC-type Fe3+ transport system permease subunit
VALAQPASLPVEASLEHAVMISLRSLFLYAPLIGHVVPTLIIGFGLVIPGSPIDGINTYTIGFLSAVLGFIPAYVAGIAIAIRWRKTDDRKPERQA